MTESVWISSVSSLSLPLSPPSPLHHRPHYGVLWRLAKTPPLKMREQLVSEGITLCILWQSARAIISHQFSAYRWTRRIWSCKHCWGKQKEHCRRTGRGSQFGGTVPICAESLFRSLHKDWIDVHAHVWVYFSSCAVKNKMYAMHTINKLTVDELYR